MKQDVMDRIKEIIGVYTYSDLANLLGINKLSYDPEALLVKLGGYVPEDYLTRDKNGTCLKLTKIALDELKREFGESLDVRAVSGYESRFFNPKEEGIHNFLIVEDPDLGSFVVDPSFKYVGELAFSPYRVVNDLVDFSLLYQPDLILGNKDAIPLFFCPVGLVMLAVKIDSELFELQVVTTEPDGDHLNYSYGRRILTGELIPNPEEPTHELEKKVRELVLSSERANLSAKQPFLFS